MAIGVTCLAVLAQRGAGRWLRPEDVTGNAALALAGPKEIVANAQGSDWTHHGLIHGLLLGVGMLHRAVRIPVRSTG